MKFRIVFIVALVILMAGVADLSAQTTFEEEQDPALISFQGRVGALLTGGEPFENGAAFEVGGMWRLAGPIHLHFFGGVSNFDKDGEIVPITEEFENFWDQFQAINDVTNVNRLNYGLDFFGGGVGFIQDLGPIELHLNGGAGAYNLEFVTDFEFVPRGIPEDEIEANLGVSSFQDREWLFGFTVGGGLYYDFNEIISFGGHVNYHSLDTEAIDDLVSVTFGMHIKVPLRR